MKRALKLLGLVLIGGLLGSVVGILNAFRGISEQKATGLGAVAGGVAEAAVTGICFTLIILIVWAVRAGGQATRMILNIAAALSLCWGLYLLALGLIRTRLLNPYPAGTSSSGAGTTWALPLVWLAWAWILSALAGRQRHVEK